MLIKSEDFALTRARLETWHRWFAWYPVRINSTELAWFHWLERKGTFYAVPYRWWWKWKYRLPLKGDSNGDY